MDGMRTGDKTYDIKHLLDESGIDGFIGHAWSGEVTSLIEAPHNDTEN